LNSVILACDQPLADFRRLLKSCQGIGSFKIGAALALECGLKNIVTIIKSETGKPVIYDHQKAGSDVPQTSERFMDVMKDSGVDSVILFPQAGPKTFQAWVAAAKARQLNVIAGGLMTHDGYVASDNGYIQDAAVIDIYSQAATMGVKSIVVPGNRPEQAKTICKIYEDCADQKPILYIPGYEYHQIIDPIPSNDYEFHLIIGRKIFNSKEPMIEIAKWASRLMLMTY